VPEAVWTYRIGAYQVCEKWLKDRRERRLELDDIRTYCRIVTALQKTIGIQGEIDALCAEIEISPYRLPLIQSYMAGIIKSVRRVDERKKWGHPL